MATSPDVDASRGHFQFASSIYTTNRHVARSHSSFSESFRRVCGLFAARVDSFVRCASSATTARESARGPSGLVSGFVPHPPGRAAQVPITYPVRKETRFLGLSPFVAACASNSFRGPKCWRLVCGVGVGVFSFWAWWRENFWYFLGKIVVVAELIVLPNVVPWTSSSSTRTAR